MAVELPAGTRWAHERDRALAEADAVLRGDVFLRVDSEGLAHRIDPDAVTAVETNDGSGGAADA